MVNSVYIHIPFCNNICTYCDFCKIYYNEKIIDNYLNELKKEIITRYKNEHIKTLYIGGGTPSSLSIVELNKLFDILKIFKFDNDLEFTFECNIEDISEEKIKCFKKNNVNRLSIGVQSFDPRLLKILGRHYKKEDIINNITLAKKYFNNINVDLIYAIESETLQDLKQDLDLFLTLNVPHISTYSLIIEPNTILSINNVQSIDEDLDCEMYNLIVKTLQKNNFNHYEISNFSKENYESKHNLTYWNNNYYYGFGLGASGYIDKIRYQNTRNLKSYINSDYIYNKEFIDDKRKIEDEFMLGLRKTKGINKKEFKNKYFDIYDIEKIKKLIKKKDLMDDGSNIFINPEKIYISNNILVQLLDL